MVQRLPQPATTTSDKKNGGGVKQPFFSMTKVHTGGIGGQGLGTTVRRST
jgi:hypothetical protein